FRPNAALLWYNEALTAGLRRAARYWGSKHTPRIPPNKTSDHLQEQEQRQKSPADHPQIPCRRRLGPANQHQQKPNPKRKHGNQRDSCENPPVIHHQPGKYHRDQLNDKRSSQWTSIGVRKWNGTRHILVLHMPSTAAYAAPLANCQSLSGSGALSFGGAGGPIR